MAKCDDKVYSNGYIPSSSTWHVGLNSCEKTKKFGPQDADDYQYDYGYLQMEIAGKDVERGKYCYRN